MEVVAGIVSESKGRMVVAVQDQLDVVSDQSCQRIQDAWTRQDVIEDRIAAPEVGDLRYVPLLIPNDRRDFFANVSQDSPLQSCDAVGSKWLRQFQKSVVTEEAHLLDRQTHGNILLVESALGVRTGANFQRTPGLDAAANPSSAPSRGRTRWWRTRHALSPASRRQCGSVSPSPPSPSDSQDRGGAHQNAVLDPLEAGQFVRTLPAQVDAPTDDVRMVFGAAVGYKLVEEQQRSTRHLARYDLALRQFLFRNIEIPRVLVPARIFQSMACYPA